MPLNNSPKGLNINEIFNKKLTQEQLTECKKAFDMHDTDKDTIITTTELVSALRALGYNANRIIIEKIKELDIESEEGVGRLNFEEFLGFVMSCIRYAYTKDDMVADLMAIDVNNDGKIAKFELEDYLKNLEVPFCHEEIQEMVNAADLDNEGFIDYNKFASMVCLHDK